MVILNMQNKSEVTHLNTTHFIAENNILTLKIKLQNGSSDYDLSGKVVTAIFQDKDMTGPLQIIDGIIQLPITNDLLKVGLNSIQLVINWNNSQELSPIMVMLILTGLKPKGPDEPSLNILSSLINQVVEMTEEEEARKLAENTRKENEVHRIEESLLREQAFSAEQSSRLQAFESAQTDRSTSFETSQNQRSSKFIEDQNARSLLFESAQDSRTQSYTLAEINRDNLYQIAEQNRDALVNSIMSQLAEIAIQQTTQDNRIADLESRSIKTYGARRTLNATSPLLERIFDAAGKVANVPTDDGAAVNDFDNIFPWSHIRECKRDATGRIHYKGDPGYDLLTNVDWLIEIPKFYIRMQRTATTFDRVISEIKRAGFWVPSVFKRADGTECDKIYVGRFKTGIVDGVDVSRPGIFPENFRDLASFRTGARAKGAGWQLIDISYKTEVLDMLYIIESATLNSQVYLGNGITTVRYVATDVARIAESAVNRIVVTNAMAGNYNVGENICIGTALGSENIARDRTILSKTALPDGVNTEIVFDGAPVNIAVGNVLWQGAQKTGQTVNLQKPNGKLSGVSGRTSNKYRSMEDIFGNVNEWVDGVLINERIAQICRDPAKYASTLTADYKPVGYTNLATDGYPLEMGFDSNFPEAIFPTTAGGGTTTGLCNYYSQNTGLRGAFFGGGANGGSFAGVFFWHLYYAPTLAGWSIGSRLLFKPPV